MQQLVVFTLGKEEYGLPITQVQEIIRYTEPRTIPSAPSTVRGVINLRGKIIPVCDLKRRLGLDGVDSDEAKIVVVETDGTTAGIVVDDVVEVLTASDEQFEPAPTGEVDCISAVVKVGDRLLVLLNLEALFGVDVADGLRLAA